MKQFKVFDKARLIYTRSRHNHNWVKGAVVTITAIGFHIDKPHNMLYELEVVLPNGHTGRVLFEQLEPLVPEKTSSWEKIQELTNWNPTKETVEIER